VDVAFTPIAANAATSDTASTPRARLWDVGIESSCRDGHLDRRARRITVLT